jgi:putative addiction module killer protein
VEANSRELRIYESSPGTAPFEIWLEELRDAKGRGVIQVRIDRLETGNFGDCDRVGEGVRELRIDFGPGYRVYFAEDGPKIILLLVGGDKKTQTRDIKTAKKYWQQYKERVRNERKLQKL